jgi:hypothetical protein
MISIARCVPEGTNRTLRGGVSRAPLGAGKCPICNHFSLARSYERQPKGRYVLG